MNITQAKSIIGSLSFPSKLPGTSYDLSAHDCQAGKELAKITGSICSDCYALRDIMSWPNAQKAYARRREAVTHPKWVEAMVLLLNKIHSKPFIRVDMGLTGVRQQRKGISRYRLNPTGYHRWHSSGDLQSLEHLTKIVEVCRQTPNIQHWLPTRELAILRTFEGPIPNNLVIRISATIFDGLPPATQWRGSTVHTTKPHPDAYVCPANQQGHRCLECRVCWSRNVPLVSYVRH